VQAEPHEFANQWVYHPMMQVFRVNIGFLTLNFIENDSYDHVAGQSSAKNSYEKNRVVRVVCFNISVEF